MLNLLYFGPSKNIGHLGRKDFLMKKYLFVLAFENSEIDDYVTEKFFGALEHGAIPIYRGAPNIDEFLPGDDAIINVNDFESPKELAEYIDLLTKEPQRRQKHYEWRAKPLRPFFRQLERDNHGDWCCHLARKLCQVDEDETKGRGDEEL